MIKKILLFTLPLLFLACTTPFPQSTLNKDKAVSLQKLSFSDIPSWNTLNFNASFESFKKSCKVLKKSSLFYKNCQATHTTNNAKAYFENYFTPYIWEDSKNKKQGLMTGYYEPLLQGSLHKDKNHTIPLLAPPSDLIKIYLSSVIPELEGKVVRGRLVGKKIKPYDTRETITANKNPENVICWVEDKVELFFLQIQGSGRIHLDTNKTIYVGYGDKNGHPYKSIGNYMIKNHIMSYGQMSLQGIKKWAKEHPDKIDAILNQNPSYLFFVENKTPAKGAMGVVLTPKHSLAVDTKYIPLGMPMLVSSTHPLTAKEFSSLAITQDRGAAIKGGRRVDFFWGFGEKAAQLAGHTKSTAQMILLLPKDYDISLTKKQSH